jgi:hypothetical protein
MAQVCKALSSNPRTAKNNNNKREGDDDSDENQDFAI